MTAASENPRLVWRRTRHGTTAIHRAEDASGTVWQIEAWGGTAEHYRPGCVALYRDNRYVTTTMTVKDAKRVAHERLERKHVWPI